MESEKSKPANPQRNFLNKFKTIACSLTYNHEIKYCEYFHSEKDRRKCPYSRKNQILYHPEFCKIQILHDHQSCSFCHNNFEYEYHPLRYRATPCQNYYNCPIPFCSFRHRQNQNKSQFFRFDIKTFKVFQCHKQFVHDKKICLYYHNLKDRRRGNFEAYQHVECKFQHCKKGDECSYSHNKIEQLYHPSRYKSKFCEKRLNKKVCDYHEFCSFAHSNEQITIKLIGEMERNIQFDIYEYKTVWCPDTTYHDRSQCVYAHNIQDFRRNPRQFDYIPQRCPNWRINDNIKSLEEAGCDQGMKCKFCHGWKQYDYHPIIYSRKLSINQQNSVPTPQKPIRKGSYKMTEEEVMSKKLVLQDFQIPNSGNINININPNLNSNANTQGKKNLNSIINEHLNSKNHNKNSLYSNGVPFFKPDSSSSYGSMTTKAKSQRLSHSQNDKISQMEERGSVAGNLVTDQRTGKLQISSMMAIMLHDQDLYSRDLQIFKLKQNQKKLFSKQRISRSCGRKMSEQINYSEEIYAVIADNFIIQKLRKAKVNEIKLMNLKQDQISQFNSLTPRQKAFLWKKLKEHNLNGRKNINYSSILQSVFIRFGQQNLLRKMRNKKVKEEKLVNLLKQEIQDLSFLTEEDKRDLPQIIQQFHRCNEQQFDALKCEIEKEVMCDYKAANLTFAKSINRDEEKKGE